jgi:hypothetical protein
VAVAQIACEGGNVAANCSGFQSVAQIQEPFSHQANDILTLKGGAQ